MNTGNFLGKSIFVASQRLPDRCDFPCEDCGREVKTALGADTELAEYNHSKRVATDAASLWDVQLILRRRLMNHGGSSTARY